MGRHSGYLQATLALTACLCGPIAQPGEMSDAFSLYNAHAELPLPELDSEQFAQLDKGEMLALSLRQEIRQADGAQHERIRVVSFQRVPRPQLLAWLGALDVEEGHSDRVTEVLLGVDDAGSSTWYQHVNLPWPLRNRHWVIRNGKNRALAEATAGRIWQHDWSLETNGEAQMTALFSKGEVAGLPRSTAHRAIYLDVNRGAWTVIALGPDASLVIAEATTVMGGLLPQGWVARYVQAQLGGVMPKLTARADRAGETYSADYVIFTGMGQPITQAAARTEYSAWQTRSQPRP